MKNIFRITGVILVVLSIFLIHSCKKKEEVPVITTTAVSNITATTATSGGNITSEGSSTVISRGVCWSTGTTPTIADSKTADGAGAGSFLSNIIDLFGGTTYYVRAYATNGSGIGYGMALSFKTSGQPPSAPTVTTKNATSIQTSSAQLNGTVNANYYSTVVTFEYGTTTTYGSTATATQSPVSGGTNSNVSAPITGLTAGTIYHYRIKAVNSLGTTYGSDFPFTTLGQVPTVTTLAATIITTVAAQLNGSVNANYLSTVVTFEYGTTISYGSTATATQSPVTGSTNANVSASINGLSPNTTYHYRVKTVNSLGTNYGNDAEFTTLGQPPSSITQAASSIQLNTANLFGTINANYLPTTVTFEYGNTESYGSIVTAIPNLVSGNSNTSVEANISGLTLGTTYYFRVKAVNSLGTTYGGSKTFTTLNGVATLTTTTIGSITASTATSGGNISDDGGSPVTVRGVCWSISSNPTISDNKTIDGTGTGSFVSSIIGLQENTLYYARSYATNSITTTYGNQQTFTTKDGVVTITTTAVSQISVTTAVGGGNISDDGGSPVTVRGVCWSISSNPTISDNKTSDGTGTGSFISSIMGLQENTSYHMRAYATNAFGTYYGADIIFKTLNVGQIADIDGNVYNTVSVGTQTWLSENLSVTKYNDGASIPLVTGPTWKTLATPAYCWYNNDEPTYKATYGALYNWYTVNSRRLCPTGWHVPSDTEWSTVTTYLGGEGGAGEKLKESGTAHWSSPNNGTNVSGFTALPGGYRSQDGLFGAISTTGIWWSSSEYSTDRAWCRIMYNNYIVVVSSNSFNMTNGFSVRCLKD